MVTNPELYMQSFPKTGFSRIKGFKKIKNNESSLGETPQSQFLCLFSSNLSGVSQLVDSTDFINPGLPSTALSKGAPNEISNKSQLMHSQLNSRNTQRELFHLIPCIVSISFFVLQTQNTDLSSHKTSYTMPKTPGDIGSSTAYLQLAAISTAKNHLQD